MSKVVKKVSGAIFGGGGKTGILGTGKFKGTSIGVKRQPFEQSLAGRGDQESIRKKQTAGTQRLEDRATGKSPSIADAQLKAASSRSLAQQLAAAQARRGGGAGLQERALARSADVSRRQVSEQAVMAKLQEQQAAEQQLAQQLQAQRAQDIALAQGDRASQQALQNLLVQQNLGVQGVNLSGFQSAAQARGGVAKGVFGGIAQALSGSDKNLKTKIKKESSTKSFKLTDSAKAKIKDLNLSKKVKSSSEKDSKKKSKDKKDKPNAFSAALSGLGKGGVDGTGKRTLQSAISRISDENSKTNINAESSNKKEDFSPQGFLDALKPYSYEYKDNFKGEELGGSGRFLSPMAQDIEKAGPVGRSMVIDTPEGKIVDYGKGLGAMLASQAHLNERLKAVESNGFGAVIKARKGSKKK